MRFSQRMGVVPPKPIQVETMEERLRTRLYNTLLKTFERILENSFEGARGYLLDKLGYAVDLKTSDIFKNHFFASEWFVPYDICEFIFEWVNSDDYPYGGYPTNISPSNYIQALQKSLTTVLEEENSGYRLIGYRFVPITNQTELSTLQESTQTKFESVNEHVKKAIALYSDRENPDYENSIKESISAVEAMCRIITGEKTLGNALKNLTDHGVKIHKALEDAFLKLYGYASDEGGIRHANIPFTTVPIEDAKFMLVTCSAFVNYLIAKSPGLEAPADEQDNLPF